MDCHYLPYLDRGLEMQIKHKFVIISHLLVGVCIGAIVFKRVNKKYESLAEEHYKLNINYNFLMSWLSHKGFDLSEDLSQKGYKIIAVYGMGSIGKLICKSIDNSVVRIEYGIDKNESGINSDIKILNPENNLPEVDAIIVTPVYYYDDIKKDLIRKVSCPIISLYDLIN